MGSYSPFAQAFDHDSLNLQDFSHLALQWRLLPLRDNGYEGHKVRRMIVAQLLIPVSPSLVYEGLRYILIENQRMKCAVCLDVCSIHIASCSIS